MRKRWISLILTEITHFQSVMTQNPPQKMDAKEVLQIKLNALKSEHRDLDEAIGALEQRDGDTFTVRRLKKQKLALKDRIQNLEDRLTPDIIA